MEAASATVLDRLREDHHKVKQLFVDFESTTESQEKQRIVKTALYALQEHAYVEEKAVYPVFEASLDDGQLVREALEEHHVVHLLIAELQKLSPADQRFEAKFAVLAENVKHHIKEEEGEIFPRAEGMELDWASLSDKALQARERFATKRGFGKSGAKSKN
jgi:hemerythrin superfamily protein